MTKVLTMKFSPHDTLEVHALNPGESFPGFGGSRHALVVGKTASLVVRRRTPMGQHDRELDIHAAEFWSMLGKMLDGSAERPLSVQAEAVEV